MDLIFNPQFDPVQQEEPETPMDLSTVEKPRRLGKLEKQRLLRLRKASKKAENHS